MISSAVTMTVRQTAEFSEQPEPVTVETGETARFTVKAVGASPIKYQWQVYNEDAKSWEDVDRATSSSYSLAKVTKEMSGRQYRCCIMNGGLSDWLASESAVLTVNTKTEVSTPETSKVVFENDEVEIKVEAKAQSPIMYTWQKMDGREWVDVSEGKIEADESFVSLVVKGGELSAATKYQCLVWSGNGENAKVLKSKTITVTPCDLTTVVPNEKTCVLCAFDGGDAAMTDANCKAKFAVTAKGYGAMKYQWYSSDDNGSTWDEIEKATSSLYQTPRLVASSGDFDRVYKCVVSNAAGEVESDTFKVERLYAMQAADIEKIGDITCTNVDTVTFTAATKYDEYGIKLGYLWKVDKNDGKGYVNAGSTSKTLKVSRPNVSLNGAKYMCLVSNAGNAKNEYASSNAATLTVRASATMSKGPVSVTTITGNKAEFSVSAAGYNVKYTWEIRDSKNNVLYKVVTDEPTFSYVFDSELKSARVYCTVQSYDDDGVTLLGTAVTKQATINAMQEISVKGLTIGETGAENVTLTENGSFRASYGFTLSLTAEAEGYSPRYQWYESIDGGAFAEIKTGKSKLYRPSIAEKDWTGVSKKSYYCKVYNQNAGGASEDYTPIVDVSIGDPAAPADWAGRGLFFKNESENFANLTLLCLDKSQIRIIPTDSEMANSYFKSSTYTYRRLDSKRASITLRYTLVTRDTETGKEVSQACSYTGSVIFDSSGNTAAVALIDSNSDDIYYGTLSYATLTGEAPASLPLGVDMLASFNESDTVSINMSSATQCVVDDGKSQITYRCSYVRKSNSIGVLTLNGTDAGGATVQLEMALCFTDAENAIGVATKTSTLNRVKTVTMSRILLSIPSGDGE